ncbi:uncharacterized protein A1O5_11206 [Cladophialophora psammophila CBS 110553]|uniref:Uncharacterized protein n=1 Tax=Cladophialophora psammophila CBS 110553 TaxID=1182543 RepID=W9X5E6_9EURO|nr:uncharacterized protein A1O5_11206 [Cladophialophora psammophila CBS 110553]EXJ65679.1 hypothetical protein A1O5_11206 [Cladophialophora psammophila CBS 110553]
MGDAGPLTPDPLLPERSAGLDGQIETDGASPLREVKVLVTGFGPFKSFLINPSWLIASALPEELYPSPSTDSPQKAPDYKITLIVYPSAIRVSYSTVSTTVPTLISTHNPDFVLHIGMAGGRDCYSLETRGHRDNYRIKDVDDCDGFTWGENRWKTEGVPEVLYVGWDEVDVLARWEEGVQTGLRERGFLGRGKMERALTEHGKRDSEIDTLSTRAVPLMPIGRGTIPLNLMWGTSNVPISSTKADENRRKAVVKLSCDAGRFLCEYALFESLSRRWLESQRRTDGDDNGGNQKAAQQKEVESSLSGSPDLNTSASSNSSASQSQTDHAPDRLGKVAFLHVPGWTGVEDINRGVMVAEEVIRALVGSWEDGYRRKGIGARMAIQAYTKQHSEEAGRVASPWRG